MVYHRRKRPRLTILWAVFSVIFCRTTRGADATPLEQFTGARTRIVWLQDHGKAANDVLAAGKQLRLMKFDSQDGRGETPLLGELRNYSKPLLTPDGQRVVYSDQVTQKFIIINWDGTGRKALGDGFAIDVCRGPADGTDWVYVAKRFGKPEVAVYRNVRRVKLDDPKISQKVWDLTDISYDNFQLSADLTQVGSGFPWPHGGVADLNKKTWKKLDQGCWPSLAPDNSGLNWVLDGPHRHLQFHRPDQADGWKVEISTAPAVKGAEVFHPRWSNHVRFFAVSGPYQIQGPINLISGGGPQVEIQIGRFSPDFRSVEDWFQLTDNLYADFYPDVWIEGGESSVIELPGLKNTKPSQSVVEWPGVTRSLLFAWSHGAVANQLADTTDRPGQSCKVTPHGPAIFDRFFDLRPRGGTFTLDDLEPALIKAIRGSGEFTLEMVITSEQIATKFAAICEIGRENHLQLQLRQSSSRLQWTCGTDQGQIDVPAWKVSTTGFTDPVHLVLTLSAKQIILYLDGKLAGTFPRTRKPEAWTTGEVRIGSVEWRGRVESVALFGRALSTAEAARQALLARRRLGARKPISQVRLNVKYLELCSIPTPEQILPYRRALVFDVCEVVSLEVGRVGSTKDPATKTGALAKPGDKILVARWVILDGQTLPNATITSGTKATLTLEQVTDHPELESERQMLDTTELDLPMWYTTD